MLFSRKKDTKRIEDLERENSELRKELKVLRDEVDDHLSAINENTNEIQQNYEVLCQIESRMEKLAERIESIFLNISKKSKISEFSVQPLTKHEQEVFLALYMLSDHLDSVSYYQIARRLCLSEEGVASYVSALIQKGVPIKRVFVDNKALLSLDSDFKSLQAKKGVVHIDSSVSKALS